VLATEEEEEVLVFAGKPDAKYGLVFDPLDGSSNIDCNVSVGSIFGIYKRPGFDAPHAGASVAAGGAGAAAGAAGEHPIPSASDVLQPGRKLVAAGYCMYGSSTEMVLTLGEGVHVFSLDPGVGEFILTRRNLQVPEKPQRVRGAGIGAAGGQGWSGETGRGARQGYAGQRARWG